MKTDTMPELDCIREEYRDWFQKRWADKKRSTVRLYLHGLYDLRDTENPEVYAKRHLFCDFPPALRQGDFIERDGKPQKRYPPLPATDADFYTDGVRADSEEGQERSKRNAAHLKRMMEMIVEGDDPRPLHKAWDYLHGREIDEVVTVPETLEDLDIERDTEDVPF